MFRSTSIKPPQRISRSVEKNNSVFARGIIFVLWSVLLTLSVTPASAQQVRTTTLGETVAVELERKSSFLSWSLSRKDPSRVAQVDFTVKDLTGPDRFTFEAVGTGQANLEFQLEQNTVFGSRVVDTETVQITIRDSQFPSSDTVTIGQNPPKISEDVLANLRTGREPSGASSSNQEVSGSTPAPNFSDEWDRVKEMIQLEEFQAARNVIDSQIERLQGRDSADNRRKVWRWGEQRAETYLGEGNFEQAIETWQDMIEDYPTGPVPKWRLSIAEAYRQSNQDDQAQLELLKIRHRHQGSPQWVDAMIMLADIASQQGKFERTRNLLENARRSLQDENHPKLLYQLARLYDRYESIRNYERAVRLYEQASQVLADKNPDLADEASSRARYLRENFVQFGFD